MLPLCSACAAAMFAMQAKPKIAQQQQQLEGETATGAEATQQQQQTPQQQAAATAQTTSAADKPLIVLLDVHLDAPVLLMPLNSNSEDHIEVDLGTLQLANRVVWELRTEQDRQKLLLDELQVGTEAGQLPAGAAQHPRPSGSGCSTCLPFLSPCSGTMAAQQQVNVLMPGGLLNECFGICPPDIQ